MKSGIYIYTFTSGDNYVGQAVDIEKRWDQHVVKMEKGIHTKLIQNAYNEYGLPRFRVLLNCHPDYLDAMEAWCIKEVNPTLNTSIPVCYDDTPKTFIITESTLKDSLFTTLYTLDKLKKSEQENEDLVQALEEESSRLHRRILEVAREVQPKEIKEYINKLEKDTKLLSIQLKTSQDRIYEYDQLPWYKRLFHTV